MSRQEVQDYIVDSISNVLETASITYVKWDMNRNITEISSSELPHRYILGLYSVLDRIMSKFPDVLFEGCSGGGGRFDAGMLYYFPQYWTSDDTDAIERLYIQHGTSMVMPTSAMGAHISAVPNHQVARTTPFETRGNVAMIGQFGYELDLNKLNEEETELVKKQVEKYKKIRNTVHYGDMYRLKSPFDGNNTAWEFVSKDKSQVVLMYCTIFAHVQTGLVNVKFCGLEPKTKYENIETHKIYTGEYLMNVGLNFADDKDFESRLLIFKIR